MATCCLWCATSQYCPVNSYVYKAVARYEPRNTADDVALSNVKFYCKDIDSLRDVGTIKFNEGHSWGSWRSSKSCNSGYWGKYFRVLIMREQGGWYDDYGAANIRFGCNYNKGGGLLSPALDGSGRLHQHELQWYPNHDWTTECDPYSYVCGTSLKVEAKQNWGDDSAVNGLRFICCRAGYSKAINIYRRCKGAGDTTRNSRCDTGRWNERDYRRNNGLNCRG